MSVRIAACGECDRASYPDPLLCPHCGSSSWNYRSAESGVLESCTRTRDGAWLGTVRTDVGPVVVARLAAEAHVGDALLLGRDGAVILAVAPRAH